MELCTKDCGLITCIMDEASCTMRVEIFMKESLSMTWLKVSECTGMHTVRNMLATGIKINSTDSDEKNGTMEVCTKDSMSMQAKTARVSTDGQMEIDMLENGSSTC